MTDINTTVPDEIEIKVVGLPADLAGEMEETLRLLLDVIGSRIDLSGLDGVTFASDYHQALLDLNRGYATDFKLTPSDDHGVGVAMSPSVIRGNQLKTHIVLNAKTLLTMVLEKRHDLFRNTIAHECAHVELNRLFDIAFPGFLLRIKVDSLEHFRIETMLACWNEFGACWRSASIGPSGLLAYEDAFLPALEQTRTRANAAIMAYRVDNDAGTVLSKVLGLYSGLLKYSAYHLGNLHGLGVDWRTVPSTAEPLQDHWFLPYFERLDSTCKAIAANLGNWSGSDLFDALRDLAEEVVGDGGVFFTREADGRVRFDIVWQLVTSE